MMGYCGFLCFGYFEGEKISKNKHSSKVLLLISCLQPMSSVLTPISNRLCKD